MGEQGDLIDQLVVEQPSDQVAAAVHLQLTRRLGFQLTDDRSRHAESLHHAVDGDVRDGRQFHGRRSLLAIYLSSFDSTGPRRLSRVAANSSRPIHSHSAHADPGVRVLNTRTTMVTVPQVLRREIRQIEGLSKHMYADQRNLQPTQGRSVMFRTKTKKQPAPAQPVKTGLFKTKKQPAPAQPVKTGLFKTKKQPAPAQPVKTGLFKTKKQPTPPPTKTGLMSKAKALFSSRKQTTATTPEAKEPVRRK